MDNYSYDEATHSVNGNLLLNATKRSVPYAIYYTKQGISAKSGGDIVAWSAGCGVELLLEYLLSVVPLRVFYVG